VDPESFTIGAVEQSRSNTGLSAQASITALGRLLLNGGLRLEHEGGRDGAHRWATLPTVGAAFVSVFGPATLKLRTAYGRAIRWPDAPDAASAWLRARDPLLCPDLEPEQQAGTEVGLDLSVGRAFSLQLTRFDQTASGLMQQVSIAAGPASTHSGGGQVVAYVMQNVGRIENTGWEAAALLEQGRFSLGGTLALVDSRVRQVVPGYTGDLRPGDRMLAVPALTTSLTAGWRGTGWSGSLTATRAADWINYDRVALAGLDPAQRPLGDALRAYWRAYDGVTYLRAAFTRDLMRGFTLTLVGDNLLDYQVGEPDNLTVLPGRTISLGVRAAF
jgi:iron complex outermembrane receptor protein